jgi:hypothetical protein
VPTSGFTDSNSNPIFVPPSTNTIVSTLNITLPRKKSLDVFVIGEFSAECPAAAGDFVVGDIQVDGNTMMNTQINNLNGPVGTIVVVSGVLSVRGGPRRFDLRAFTRAANFSAHHRSLTVLVL